MKNDRNDARRPEGVSQEYFRTGYVIEMQRGRYFAGWNGKRICCRAVDRARYFSRIEEAECYIRRKLGFAGLRVHICRVCWTLVEMGTTETEWRFVKEKDGRVVKFSAYQEAADYQMDNSLQTKSVIDIYAFPEKEIFLAA